MEKTELVGLDEFVSEPYLINVTLDHSDWCLHTVSGSGALESRWSNFNNLGDLCFRHLDSLEKLPALLAHFRSRQPVPGTK